MNTQAKVVKFVDIHQETMILSHAIARKAEEKMTIISLIFQLYFFTIFSYLK